MKVQIQIYDKKWKDLEFEGYMRKFRKKPVVVEAVQVGFPFRVLTDEGLMSGIPGDWLIRGVKGEFIHVSRMYLSRPMKR